MSKFHIRVSIIALIAASFLFLTVGFKTVSAVVVIDHQGSNDPTTEGWTLNNPGSPGTLAEE